MSNLIIASSTYKKYTSPCGHGDSEKTIYFFESPWLQGVLHIFYEILAYIADVIQYNIGL